MKGIKLLSFTLLVLLGFAVGTSSAQVKKTISVANFENKSGYRGFDDLGFGMADMLTDALFKSNQFIILERHGLDAIMAEQNLAASGRATAAGTAASKGDIKKAQIIIQGAVTEFQELTRGGGQNISLYDVTVSGKTATAHVAIILRLVDTTTSEVLASHRVEGEAQSSSLNYSAKAGVVRFGQEGFYASPLGRATQLAIDRAVAFIVNQMQRVAWKGKVIRMDTNGSVLVNAGQNAGLVSGTILRVNRPVGRVLDPETGVLLGTEMESLGTIRVHEVLPKYSKAEPIYLSKFVETGDDLELVT